MFQQILFLYSLYHFIYAVGLVYQLMSGSVYDSPGQSSSSSSGKKKKSSKKSESQFCDVLCSLYGLTLILGFFINLFSIIQQNNTKSQCFNYVHQSMVWTTLEISAFLIWVGTQIAVARYLSVISERQERKSGGISLKMNRDDEESGRYASSKKKEKRSEKSKPPQNKYSSDSDEDPSELYNNN